MRYAEKDLAGLAVTLCDKGFVGLAQGFVPCLVSLDDFPGPLVYDKDVVVLIYYPACEVIVFSFRQSSVFHIVVNYDTKVSKNMTN